MNKGREREWIDNASYEELLSRWRNAPFEDTIFTGDLGAHYKETMRVKGDKAGIDERIRVSKKIGWG